MYRMTFNELVSPINKTVCLRIIDAIERSNDTQVSSTILTFTKEIINILPYQPHICNTFRRSIQLEYDLADDIYSCYLEIEIFDDKCEILIVYDRNYQSSIRYELSLDIDMIKQHINTFFDVAKAKFI